MVPIALLGSAAYLVRLLSSVALDTSHIHSIIYRLLLPLLFTHSLHVECHFDTNLLTPTSVI